MKSKIRMTKDAHGCEDGFTSRHYKHGEHYEVENHLANNFVVAGCAEHIEGKEKAPHDNKALNEKDYDNKAVKPNKRERRKS